MLPELSATYPARVPSRTAAYWQAILLMYSRQYPCARVLVLQQLPITLLVRLVIDNLHVCFRDVVVPSPIVLPIKYPWPFKGTARSPSIAPGRRYRLQTPHLESIKHDAYAGTHCPVRVPRAFSPTRLDPRDTGHSRPIHHLPDFILGYAVVPNTMH